MPLYTVGCGCVPPRPSELLYVLYLLARWLSLAALALLPIGSTRPQSLGHSCLTIRFPSLCGSLCQFVFDLLMQAQLYVPMFEEQVAVLWTCL